MSKTVSSLEVVCWGPANPAYLSPNPKTGIMFLMLNSVLLVRLARRGDVSAGEFATVPAPKRL